MRVAVCFSGMPRSFKTVYESHKKFIFDVLSEQGIEYDIFIHINLRYHITVFTIVRHVQHERWLYEHQNHNAHNQL